MYVILCDTALLTHTQVSVLSVTTAMALTIQCPPREDTDSTPVLRGTKRMRVRRTRRRNSGGETGENSPKRAATEERRVVGPVQQTFTLPSVSLGISCYMDGTTPVGVSPMGGGGPVGVHSHAHSRIPRCQDLECRWSLDSSKSILISSAIFQHTCSTSMRWHRNTENS